ncbi:disintegrin and metalloproteinase domain-containing protein 21 [Erinaceus europaeus]|uniref:Disintegrin and metalloproteinase domain-containing protein 21 n=1 Tax=Erinaceus europaeus TaxID=9365 RepID=A0A1S3A2V8_ERIEU|nr:disintegrin and metalloproteinase domain-containing protein 21 [Erinaceus europaeus]
MTAVETKMSMRILLLLLWHGISVSLSVLSEDRYSQLSSPEFVTPLKITSRGRDAKAPGWLSYSLKFGGQRHVVHMRVKKFLLSRNLPILTYTDLHALHQDQPAVPADCYYHGYVEGRSNSLVALSTCFGGFQGMLQISGLAYEIEPLRNSTTFEHLVYKLNINGTQLPSMRCGLAKETAYQQFKSGETEKSTLKQNSTEMWWAHSWFLELVVVVDNGFFMSSQSNFSKVQEDVFFIVNVVDSIYQQLDTYVILIGIEIWNHGNVFLMTSIEQVLEDFSRWKQASLSQLQYDTAHIFIKNSLINVLGIAYVAGICHPPIDCGVNNFQGDPLSLFALTVAHELGHTLGMRHDEEFCVCKQNDCIMNAIRMPAEGFTNCSYADFAKTALNQGSCLSSPPSPGKVLMLKRCGNGVIEGEEECDCGSTRQCEKDPCCLMNCTLKPGATCAFGLCCKACKFMPSGRLCRHQANECDLPEWCNGTSHECPEDRYVQDGFPCSGSAYCYQKRCNSHDKQCREIFGDGAKSASQSCYTEINSQGNNFGHCGISGMTYLKCNISDVFCGRIQCENVKKIPHLQDHSALQSTHIHGVTCWSVNYHLGMNTPDAGEVKDGTMCGPGKICMHKQCVRLSLLSQDCLPETCHMRGVCNNKHHCHCNYGWAPPNCLHRGYGGSIDSGPASTPKLVLPLVVILGLAVSFLLMIAIFLYLLKYIHPKKTKVHSSG